MKTSTIKTSILSLLAVLFIGNIAFSQYDDLYYEASDEVYFADIEEEYVAENNEDYGYSSFDEDDGYHYTSRIRRFSRPTNSLSYFSPIYTNTNYYGRYNAIGFNNSIYSPTGVRIIGNNAYGYSSLSNPYLNPYARNTFGGYNSIGRIGGAGFSNAYYCPPVGGFASTRPATTTNNNVRGGSTVNSSRRAGTVSSSTPSRAGSTRTVRTSRDYRGSSSTRSAVRTNNTRTSSRSTRSNFRTNTRSNNSRSYSSPRSSSTRSSSVRSSAPRSSSSSSRGSRG